MIQWFSKNERLALATIYSTNITLNKFSMEMMKDSYACMLGLDSEAKKVAIQPISQDEFERKEFPEDNMFLLSGGKTYLRVSSSDFVKKVADLIGTDFKDGARKYSCYYDEHEKIVIIDLLKEVK